MRVLVVEDSMKMAALLKRGLQEEGYSVDLASNGVFFGSNPSAQVDPTGDTTP